MAIEGAVIMELYESGRCKCCLLLDMKRILTDVSALIISVKTDHHELATLALSFTISYEYNKFQRVFYR